MDCISVDGNESEELWKNLLEEIDQVITMTLNAEQPLSCDVAHVDSDSNDEEMGDVQQQRLEEQEVIHEVLMKNCWHQTQAQWNRDIDIFNTRVIKWSKIGIVHITPNHLRRKF